MTTNQLAYRAQLETERSNLARETETNRHNLVTEDVSLQELAERIRSNKENEKIKWSELSEKQRSNLVNESIKAFEANVSAKRQVEDARHNKAMETETNRHNVEGEKLGWANHSESVRHDQEQESLGWATHAENVRSHKAGESISWANHAENVRTHKEQESNTRYHNYTERSKMLRETSEKERHDRVEEVQNQRRLESDIALHKSQIDVNNAEIVLKEAMASKTDAERTNIEKEIAYKTDAWIKEMEKTPGNQNHARSVRAALDFSKTTHEYVSLLKDLISAGQSGIGLAKMIMAML